jgi:tetratricopeptide (TPR) repeat protein
MVIAPERRGRPALLGNRYRLLDTLGSGGMGVVYRAEDRLTGEVVALKQVLSWPMQPEDSAEVRLALTREFQALASLRHPHIIAVRDYGFDSSRQPYFTMELLPQAQTMVAAGQFMTAEQKVNLLLQLLYALAYLHRRGIVHRDLKPGNVLVSGGEVKVLDFGLAALAGEAGSSAGTLAYMAPEVLRGQAAGSAADLYAVGVLGYELFAGWRPFDVSGAAGIQAILEQEVDWSLVEIEPDLQGVLGRLLAKRPESRYADAQGVMMALGVAIGRLLPVETAATRESFLQAAPFTGRAVEVARLQEAFKQALGGRGGAWLVGGESGVGKSRLLNEVRTMALVQGALVVRGQASEGGGPYHLWPAVLRPLLLLAEVDELEAGVLKALIPDVRELVGRPVADAPPLEPNLARTRLLVTVATVFQRGARERAVLLLLDDLQWADEGSLAVLEWLVRQASQWPLFILGTYRRDERADLRERLPAMTLLPLPRLAAEELSALSVAMLGQTGRRPELLTFLQRETEGNTFFVVEVMRALAEEAGRLDSVTAMALPLTVFAGGMRQMVQRRLQRVPEGQRPLLWWAAVAGRQPDLAVLGVLEPALDVEEWLTVCANAAVLEVQDGRWQFAHDKLREGVLSEMADAERGGRHEAVAEAIEGVYVADLEPHYATLAFHFGQAGNRGQERRYLGLAAERAQATYANEAAIAAYERLLSLGDDEGEKVEVLLKLAAVLKLVGRWPEAEERLQVALAAAEGNQFPGMQARCRYALGSLRRSQGAYDEAMEWLEQAAAGFAVAADKEGLRETYLEMGEAHYRQGAYGQAAEQVGKSLALAQEAGDQVGLALALHLLGSVAYSQGMYGEARGRYEESITIRQGIDDKWGMANSLNNLGNLAYKQGDFIAAQGYYQESLALRRAIGDKWGISASLNNLGIVPYLQGEYAAAKPFWEESLAIRRELGDKWSIAGSVDNLGLVAFSEGELAKAVDFYRESLALRREIGDKQGIGITLSNLAHAELDLGDYGAARQHYQESLQVAHEIDDKRGIAFCLGGLACVTAEAEGAAGAKRAIRLAAAAAQLLERLGVEMERDEKVLFERARGATQAVMAAEDFAAAWEAGRATAMEMILVEALSGVVING